MKKITLTTLLALSSLAFAQNSAQEGLNRIKSNLDNSKSNLSQYQSNLEIVGKNIEETKKAQQDLKNQEAENRQLSQKISAELAKVGAHEVELKKQIDSESQLSSQEQKKLQELKRDIEILEKNALVRTQNLNILNTEMTKIQDSKSAYISKESKNKEALATIIQAKDSMTKEEQTWINKQRGYQGEVNRWKKEVDRNQKLLDSYSNLAQPRN